MGFFRRDFGEEGSMPTAAEAAEHGQCSRAEERQQSMRTAGAWRRARRGGEHAHCSRASRDSRAEQHGGEAAERVEEGSMRTAAEHSSTPTISLTSPLFLHIYSYLYFFIYICMYACMYVCMYVYAYMPTIWSTCTQEVGN
jgi:hypothetical protein